MPTTKATFRRKPYMTLEYDDLWKRLAHIFRDGGFKNSTLIPFCPLSTFFNFGAFESGRFSELEKDAIRYAHLAFACVVTDVPSNPKLVSVVIRMAEHKYCTGTLRVLRSKLGVEPIMWGESESPHKLVLTVKQRIRDGITPMLLTKCPANSWGEKQTAVLIQRALWLLPVRWAVS